MATAGQAQCVVASYLFRLATWLLPLIPTRLGYWLLARVGDLTYRLNRQAREAVFDNLRHVLGSTASEQTLRDVARAVFRNQALNYFDLFRIPRLTAAQIEKSTTIEGWEHLEQALGRGKGVIIVSAHFGNFDVVMQILAIRRIPTTLVAEHIRPEEVFESIRQLRSDKGIQVVPVEKAGRAVLRTLRAGDIVGLSLDWDVTEGVIMPFFGAPARVPDSYAELARHTGAAIIVGFITRCPDNTFLAQIEPPIIAPHTADRHQDVRDTVNRVLSIAERYIRAHPDQWVMFHRIWQ